MVYQLSHFTLPSAVEPTSSSGTMDCYNKLQLSRMLSKINCRNRVLASFSLVVVSVELYLSD